MGMPSLGIAVVLMTMGMTLDARGGDPPQAVSFVTADSGMVTADLYGTGERGVVLAHLVLLSPVAIQHPEQIHAATVLYIASRDEKLAPRIRDQYRLAPKPKRLVLLDGSAHAQNIFKTAQGGQLTQVILEALTAPLPAARK